MLTKCEIEFRDIESNVIYSGDLLRGTVEFELQKEYEFRDVYVHVYGKTKVEIRTGKTSQVNKKCHIDEKIKIINKAHADDKITLSAGKHEYDFEIALPPNLPSTFNGTYGKTEYQVSIVLDSSFFSKETFSKDLIVIRPLDLNNIPNLALPLTIEKKTSIGLRLISCCYSCCVSKPVEIQVKTSKTGFTPSQVMDLEILVNNNSNRKIKKFLIRLIKIVEYTTKSKIIFCFANKKIDRTALMQYETRGCDEHKEDKIEIVVGFPPTEPTDVNRKNIKIKYAVEIVGETNWQYKDITLEVPITIGSKALIPKD